MLANRNQAWEFSLLALCIWREGRGEPYRGQRGIAWTIRNRVAHGGWWGETFSEVILHPHQFSSFNENDPNAKLLPQPGDKSFDGCLAAAEDIYDSVVADPTGGATHYCRFDLVPLPKWTEGATFCVQLGNHLFYKNVP